MTDKDKLRDSLEHLHNGETEESEAALKAYVTDKCKEVLNGETSVESGEEVVDNEESEE